MNYRKTMLAVWQAVLLASLAAAAEQSSTGRQQAEAPKPKEKSQYLRLLRNAQQNPVALQAAIVRFAHKDRNHKGPTVDLVAAVHVAEKGYYEQLNRRFTEYDAVLYELVAPKGTRIANGQTSGSPVSFLQNAMKQMLELEFQLDSIDYSPENLVHADMSPEQFAKSMQQRGESVAGMFLRMMGYAMARQHGSEKLNDGQLLLALLDKNRALALKRILAEQFEEMEGSLLAIDGPGGSTIISERNRVVMDVLRKQIAADKKTIAVFYGAGHMPDMQQRLCDEFGLTPIDTHWLDAWNLRAATGGPSKQKAVAGGRAEQKAASDGRGGKKDH